MTDKIGDHYFPEMKSKGESIHFVDLLNDEFFLNRYSERNLYLSK